MKRPYRIALRIVAGLVALVALLVVVGIFVVRSQWFYDQVRARLVTEVERATGGRVEIGSFHFDWTKMEATVAPFVLRGTEPAGEPPLARIEKLTLGLKIISLWKRDVDLSYLNLERPALNVLVDASGKTNFPEPKVKRTPTDSDPIEQILRLAIGKFRITDGWIHYGDQKIPLDLRGEHLNAALDYNDNGPRYQGEASFRQLHLQTDEIGPIAVNVDTKLSLMKGQVVLEQASLAMPRSQIQLAGEMVDFKDPKLTFDIKAIGHMEELAKPLKVPLPPVGTVSFEGQAKYSAGESYQIKGAVAGKGLAINQSGVRVNNIVLSGDLDVNKGGLWVRDVKLNALDGGFVGDLELKEFKQFTVDGRLHGFTLASLASTQNIRNLAWGGRVSGPIKVTGSVGNARDLQLDARLDVKPTGRGIPISGLLQAGFRQRTGELNLGASYLNLPSTRLDASGTLNNTLNVRLESRDLKDLQPVLAMAMKNPPKELPVQLGPGGSVLFAGTVTGRLQNPRIAGQLTGTFFQVQNQPVDRLVASFRAARDGVELQSVAVGQDTLRLTGAATLGLQNWQPVPSSPLSGKLSLQNARIGKILAAQNQKIPVDGLLNANVSLSGTYGAPQGVVQLDVNRPQAYGEEFDRLVAEIRLRGNGVEVINGRLTDGNSRILVAGAYDHSPNDWMNGKLRFEVSSENLTLSQFATIRQKQPDLRGAIQLRATGVADVEKGTLLPETLNARLAVDDLAMNGRNLGDIQADAVTEGDVLTLKASGQVQGASLASNATVRLTGDYPAKGTLEIEKTSLATLQRLMGTDAVKTSEIDGSLQATAQFEGPLRKPEALRALLTIPSVEIYPLRKTRSLEENRKLGVRNDGPIVVEYVNRAVQVRSAKLVGPGTDLRASGQLALTDVGQWNLKVDGGLNLGVLENFDRELVASGTATVQATVGGTLKQPRLAGNMTLRDASFYMEGIPNGIDKANGRIRFDQNRATIVDTITAESGGGELRLGGYIGLAGGQALYRLTAHAENVRVRYPEGVSTTSSADINFSGTSTESTVTGTVSVQRIGFNPRTDVGGLLASTATPIATPAAPNPFLRGMRLDIRIETVPNLELTTSYTNELEATADLRLRGTAAKPVLSGRANIDSGEIQFFGTKYIINRGDIAFYNPVKIEPVVDLDLETTVRGVVVNISVAGTPQRLNVSYRSDPPLQSNEIVALLAVGRAPGTNSSLASSQTVQTQNFLASGTNTLLGQAVAAPVSNRLQRFFGVSRLKIDPMLTGINAVPQARLTVEQQISKDITLTYVTNLAQVNQQIIRVEWDLNRNWSLLAVREENGAFGIDFLYKKRFK
jgi:translocation and assembly module TamB